MKIEDFELEILKASPGDTVVIKFPLEKYDLDCLRQSFDSLESILPVGVGLMMIPYDWDIGVEKNDNLY